MHRNKVIFFSPHCPWSFIESEYSCNKKKILWHCHCDCGDSFVFDMFLTLVAV